MPKYLTAGWETFSFIVTPAELEAVLADMHLLIVTRRVPEGYKETPLCEYIAHYSALYNKLMSGQQLVHGDIGRFMEIGIAKSLETHTYGGLITHRGQKYQLTDFDEPCASMGYFPMHIYTSAQGKITLTISASTSQFPERTVGLELLFPKQIQYVCGSNYTPLQPTKDLPSYQDFVTLRDRIKAITRPLRLVVAGKEIRPRVRISQNALQDIDRSWLFQTNDIHAVK